MKRSLWPVAASAGRERYLAVVVLALFGIVQGRAATGDNAPPIPATYNTSHPRLPSPDAAYLAGLAGNSTALASYNAAADAWDSTNPGNPIYFRRLLIAYMVNKTTNPTKAATYLAKIKALANLGGTWSQLLYSVNDGAGTGGYTVTSASANFLTGCNGGSCQGYYLSILARAYEITSVPDAHTLVVYASNPPITGTNLPFRIFTGVGGMSQTGINIAILYDWIYADLDSASRTEFMNELESLSKQWEETYAGVGASPYNDVLYVDVGSSGLITALAIYPDHPKGQTHLRYMMDVWFNVMLPVWSQVFGPEGGGWHESWTDYVNNTQGAGIVTFLVPTLLSWQSATGDPIFTRYPWLKNFAYFSMYMTRPDFTMQRIGDISEPYLTGEYDLTSGAAPGSLNGLAEIYNDPLLRGWARLVNHEAPAGPAGFEPSAWPFYSPDTKSKTAASRAGLPTTRNFTGWGVIDMRTGWTEDDTDVTFKYGDNFWSHQHADAGSFTIYNRGSLAIDSGTYRAGAWSQHKLEYARSTIAHNTLTVTDPADWYPMTFTGQDTAGNWLQATMDNEGGQRRVGSPFNEHFPAISSPSTIGAWMSKYEYYRTGKMLAYASTPAYTYAATDITAAYNNSYSASTPNDTNRTKRVASAVRHIVFIPRGTAAYVVVFDQVQSANSSFVKRWLLHSVNQPTANGSAYTITRNDLVTGAPYNWTRRYASQISHCPGNDCSTGNQYQYDGKLYGWMVQPAGGTLSVVGGPGKEFWIEDPTNPGTGHNWNQCQITQCDAVTEGLGPVQNFVNPVPTEGPKEPGSWRIEEKPGSAAAQDYFLNVMLATTAEDAEVPSNVTIPSGLPAGAYGATWVDNGKTYTITFPGSGVAGAHIAVTGVVDEDLLSHAQQLPDKIQALSGTPQSGGAGTVLANPLVVSVQDALGSAVPNAYVHFGISAGAGQLSADTVMTDSQGQASVTLTLGAGTAGSLVSVMADVNGLPPVEFDATLTTPSSSVVTQLSCSPASLIAGASSTCTVTLSQSAPSGGAVVNLASNTPGVTVPGTVTVPAGSTTASFTASSTTAGAGQTAAITATLNGGTQTASIAIAPAALTLVSVTCPSTNVFSGTTANCSVSLSQTAGTGGISISLSSNTAALTVPPTVTVPAGYSSQSFSAVAGPVTAVQSATVTAQYASAAKTVTLTIQPSGTTGISIPTGTWTMVSTHGFPVQTVGYEKLVYAPAPVKKAVMLGDYHEMSSEPNNALIAYDFEANQWSVLDMTDSFHTENMPEAGHTVGGFAFDPNRNIFVYYCCASGSNQPETPNFTWWYDPFGQTGRNKQTSPKPGYIQLESSSFDTLNDAYVIHGGTSWEGTWTYNPSTNTYQQQTPAGTPPDASLDMPAMSYNTKDHQIYLFGGMVYPHTYFNDLFSYNVATNTWTKLNPSGPRPAPRWECGFAYDSTNNVFLLYGGEDATTIYSDTWVYDPAANTWSQLTPAQSPPAGKTEFERLAYDSDHNVFVMVVPGSGGYADASWSGYGLQTWFFRYKGSGPNAGTMATSYAPTANSINRNTDAWATMPSLAASGSSLLSAWGETGRPSDTSNAAWFHIYSAQETNGSWSALGGLSNSLDSELSNYTESHAPSIAVVAGIPWISWYKLNNGGLHATLYAKSWNGSSWVGDAIGKAGSDPTRAFQGPSQMADVAGIAHIAFLEVDKTYYPPRTFAYVKYWNGTSWVLKGTGPLNINAGGNTAATSVSIASDGANPYVAWAEYTAANGLQSETNPRVYVAHWTGTQWVNIGGALNVDSSSWADSASIAFAGGRPYVAWTERSTGGNAQLFVKMFDGTNWVLTGSGALNKDTNTGWAFHPSLAVDPASSKLYIGWVEQQAIGQPSQSYVSVLTNGVWTALGGSLNADPASGSAQRISLAIAGGQPAAAWGEVKFGSLRQVFAKQWNGTGWSLLAGNGPPIPLPPASSRCDLNSDGSVNALDIQIAINQVLGMATCGSADLIGNGQCSIVDVQRVINASLGGACVTGQ